MGLVKLENLETLEESLIDRIKEKPRTLVIDSSVCIKWFSKDGEDDLDNALLILNLLKDGKIIVVSPELVLYELANVLYYKPGFDLEKTRIALEEFLNLGIELIKIYKDMVLLANEIMYELGVTFYDSSYLAVARFFELKFITADKKLFSVCQKIGYVEFLKNFRF